MLSFSPIEDKNKVRSFKCTPPSVPKIARECTYETSRFNRDLQHWINSKNKQLKQKADIKRAKLEAKKPTLHYLPSYRPAPVKSADDGNQHLYITTDQFKRISPDMLRLIKRYEHAPYKRHRKIPRPGLAYVNQTIFNAKTEENELQKTNPSLAKYLTEIMADSKDSNDIYDIDFSKRVNNVENDELRNENVRIKDTNPIALFLAALHGSEHLSPEKLKVLLKFLEHSSEASPAQMAAYLKVLQQQKILNKEMLNALSTLLIAGDSALKPLRMKILLEAYDDMGPVQNQPRSILKARKKETYTGEEGYIAPVQEILEEIPFIDVWEEIATMYSMPTVEEIPLPPIAPKLPEILATVMNPKPEEEPQKKKEPVLNARVRAIADRLLPPSTSFSKKPKTTNNMFHEEILDNSEKYGRRLRKQIDDADSIYGRFWTDRLGIDTNAPVESHISINPDDLPTSQHTIRESQSVRTDVTKFSKERSSRIPQVVYKPTLLEFVPQKGQKKEGFWEPWDTDHAFQKVLALNKITAAARNTRSQKIDLSRYNFSRGLDAYVRSRYEETETKRIEAWEAELQDIEAKAHEMKRKPKHHHHPHRSSPSSSGRSSQNSSRRSSQPNRPSINPMFYMLQQTEQQNVVEEKAKKEKKRQPTSHRRRSR